MARCSGCGSLSVTGCQCSFADTDSINYSGSGSAANPLKADLRLRDDPDQLIVVDDDGAFAGIPSNVKALLKPPSVSVYISSNQPVPDNEAVPVDFEGEAWDTDDMHDMLVLRSRLVARTAGLYVVGSTLLFDTSVSTAGFREMQLIKQGLTAFDQDLRGGGVSGFANPVQCKGVVALEEDQYVEAWVKQNSGGDVNLLGLGFVSSFWMYRFSDLP